jgi:hypothetical protein
LTDSAEDMEDADEWDGYGRSARILSWVKAAGGMATTSSASGRLGLAVEQGEERDNRLGELGRIVVYMFAGTKVGFLVLRVADRKGWGVRQGLRFDSTPLL